MKIEFYKHHLSKNDKEEVQKVLDSLFLTTGEWVDRFEKKLAAYTENKFSVGLMSCTHALELSLRYFGIGMGDEVITTPMSFIATANSIEYVGAKPVFIDVEEKTGNIDASLIERAITKKTKAIIPVHLYGQMCDMKKIRQLADAHNLKVIEDAAHCVEGKRDGTGVGELGDIACYSFYATKNLTSGEGGAISCNDPAIYEWFKMARMHGMSKNAAERYTKKYEHYDMKFLGFKCNMSNIQAALLINQIDRLEDLLKERESIAKLYDGGLDRNFYIRKPSVVSDTKHARHLFTIWVNSEKRDGYMDKLQDVGIGVAVNYRPIHLMKYYKQKYGYKPGDFPVAEKIGASTISLPFYPKLKTEEIDYIIKTVNRIIIN